MNSKEKLTYEQTLWDEFSATDFAAGKTNYPVIGIVGIIRSPRKREISRLDRARTKFLYRSARKHRNRLV